MTYSRYAKACSYVSNQVALSVREHVAVKDL